ncbi:hypothetical protein H6G89_31180 [Oscillatoria sp. FACHB-1407]|uniref:hypothetical protein n=1 Tax=Oscillatoria sp. FACHB-1407 TaxID=2692847 RepID=UPI00168591F1|nr:hypothetical protein [Oscillatoria sp. FACHB-1407]MBD2465467.1 hypothetical protein [Oscillatoria sp. FACHB-1407]
MSKAQSVITTVWVNSLLHGCMESHYQRDDSDGSLQIHVNAGDRSAQSTPLITRSGRPIAQQSD